MPVYDLSDDKDFDEAEALFIAQCQRGSTIELKIAKKQRSPAQNRAIHVLFQNVADQLNDAGYDMVKVMKEGVDIPWTGDLVKENLWRPLQKLMLSKDSTTQLDTKEVDKVFAVLHRHLAEKLGISLEFPSIESIINSQREG